MLRSNGLPSRPSIMPRAVVIDVPDGASTFWSWCSSMISADSKKRAAIFAMCIISTAPMVKFAAISPPSFRSAHRFARSSTNDCGRPVVPMTRRTPRSSATSARMGGQAAFVKSMTTSGFVSSNAAAASGISGTVPPDGSASSVAVASLSTTPTGAKDASASTASTIARPILPEPETSTRIGAVMRKGYRESEVGGREWR